MQVALYTGKVFHARLRPKRHRLAYRVFMLLLDVDDQGAGRGLRLFSRNRLNLISFHDADHGDGGPLRPQVEAKLSAAGLPVPGGPIRILSMPRVLGHGFNPLSVYYCHRPDGALAATVYEVNNTFGGRHSYVLAAEEDDGLVQQTCDKAFFVSPFMDMDLAYAFDIVPPGADALIGIRVSDGEGLVLNAAFAGVRRPLTDREILAAWLGHPIHTIGVLAMIYWQGLKLVFKGFRWRSPHSVGTPQVLPQLRTSVAKPQ